MGIAYTNRWGLSRPNWLASSTRSLRGEAMSSSPRLPLGELNNGLLHRLTEQNDIPDIPIFVDSPLAINITDIFRRHKDELGKDAAEFLDRGLDPLGFRRLRLLRDASASKTLNDLRTPFVVISASGMCEGGRILHHLRNGIGDW